MSVQPASIKAFIATTNTDDATAKQFLEVRGYNVDRALALYSQQQVFRSSIATHFALNPPYPFAIFEKNLISFVADKAFTKSDVPLLIVNLKYWDKNWTFNNTKSLSELQWAVEWVLSKALELPAVQTRGLTIVSNSDLVNPEVSVKDVHIILLEFILNVVPIKLKSFIICHAAPPTYFSRAWSLVTPNADVLNMYKTMYNVEIIECNKLTLVDHVDRSNLPANLNGKLNYRHEEWYQSQLSTFVKLDQVAKLTSTTEVPLVAQAVVQQEPSTVDSILADVKDVWNNPSNPLNKIPASVWSYTSSATTTSTTTSKDSKDTLIPEGGAPPKAKDNPLAAYFGWENVNKEEPNENDGGWLARKTRATQMDSLATTNEALSKLQQSEELGAAGLNKLHQQGEQLHRISEKVSEAEGHAKIADAKASQLRTTNQFFMLPTWGADKKAQALEQQYKSEMEASKDQEEERRRAANANTTRVYNSSATGKKAYTTPDGLERDDVEEQIDGNLDAISAGLENMKAMGLAMGEELENQKPHIQKIAEDATAVQNRVELTSKKISKIK